ncbi:hypothetical protein AB0R12_39510 [Streptomyces niveus]|uniref:hypothetical protein n=1 Tax=Streptomyces niveus TaxID=193462 RepID=UPI0034194BC9
MAEARDNFVPFPQGSICEGEPRDDCITKTTGTVIDKRTRTFCTGGNQDTGPSCSIAHLVDVRFGGRTLDHLVSSDVYRNVGRGDRADGETWRGELVSVTVHGDTRTYSPSNGGAMTGGLYVAWLILGVGMWAVRSGQPASLRAISIFLWAVLGFAFMVLGSFALLGGLETRTEGVWDWVIAVGVVVLIVFPVVSRWPDGRKRSGRFWP